jgi:hypothetical protein
MIVQAGEFGIDLVGLNRRRRRHIIEMPSRSACPADPRAAGFSISCSFGAVAVVLGQLRR